MKDPIINLNEFDDKKELLDEYIKSRNEYKSTNIAFLSVLISVLSGLCFSTILFLLPSIPKTFIISVGIGSFLVMILFIGIIWKRYDEIKQHHKRFIHTMELISRKSR